MRHLLSIKAVTECGLIISYGMNEKAGLKQTGENEDTGQRLWDKGWRNKRKGQRQRGGGRRQIDY